MAQGKLLLKGGRAAIAFSLKSTARTLLASTALALVPVGNSISFSDDLSRPVEFIPATAYRDGDTLLGVSATWNGTAESGYASWTEDGNARTMTPDKSSAQGNGTGALGVETRTTAKPICRVITPWNQRISRNTTIGVVAEAKGGIAKVRFYSEGVYVDVLAPTTYYYQDARGRWHSVTGYFVTLNQVAMLAQHGSGNAVVLFVRAYANDGTMQTQLVGTPISANNHRTTMQFFPEQYANDVKIEVTPSGVASKPNGAYPAVHARFTNVDDALKYVAGATVAGFTLTGGAVAPEIVVTEEHYYDPVSNSVPQSGSTGNYSPGKGYTVIRPETPGTLTIGRVAFNVANTGWTPNVGSIEFRNVHFDFTNMNSPHLLTAAQTTTYLSRWGGHWYNTCTSSLNFDAMQYVHPVTKDRWETFLAQYSFVTECDFTSTHAQYCWIIRNNTLRKYWNDILNHCWACVGNRIIDANKMYHHGYKVAFTVNYIGASAGAQVVKSGDSFALQTDPTGTNTWGTVLTINLAGKDAQEVVASINSFGTGWSATQQSVDGDGNDDRLLNYAVIPNGAASGTVVIKAAGVSTPLVMRTWLDLHSDIYQLNATQPNIYFGNNVVTGMAGLQPLQYGAPLEDFAYVQNSFDTTLVFLQIGGTLRHALFIANVDVSLWRINNDDAGLPDADSYTCISNNVVGSMTWRYGDRPQALQSMEMANNHVCSNGIGTPTGMSGTTTGSTVAAMFPGLSSGHLEPAPTVPTAAPWGNMRDVIGAERPNPAPKGPKAFRMTNTSLTRQQGLDLAAITIGETPGTGVTGPSLSWYSGSGNAGTPISLAVKLNISD